MPEVRETRRKNGMTDITYEDVWDYQSSQKLVYDTLIASPPCQSYSSAGKGHGRKALNDVIALIHDKAYEDIDGLREKGIDMGDERTALVLAPLHYIWKARPEYIALEQVPAVQPIWEAYVPILEGWGYNVWTDVLRSEQYGVPQTRKRAILLARKEGEIAAPPVTNSKYHLFTPFKLDEGIAPWVSIQDALGDVFIGDNGDKAEFLKLGKQENQAIRSVNTPAATLAFGNDYGSPRWTTTADDAKLWVAGAPKDLQDRIGRFTLAQATILQSYPVGFEFHGNQFSQYKQIANSVPPTMAEKILRHLWDV